MLYSISGVGCSIGMFAICVTKKPDEFEYRRRIVPDAEKS
jgi:hypothetical protein